MLAWPTEVFAQTAALEFAAGAGNPTGNGPTIANQVITFQNNTDNPTGNTFAPTTPPVTATYVLSNQTYTSAPNISTSRGLSFGASINNAGAQATARPLFPTMNNPFTSYANAIYTSAGAIPTGTGIDVAVNQSVSVFTSAEAIPANSPKGLTDRYLYATLTINFSRAVVNPVIHITDLGGNSGTLGFTTDLDLVPATGVSLTKLSGSTNFAVTAGQIRNSSTTLTAANFVSGTARVTTPAAGITSIAFQVYLHGDGTGNWAGGTGTTHSGDLFYVGFSSLTPVADVATSVAGSPNPVLAGQPLSFAVTYTNAGPNPANGYTQTLQLTPGLGAGNVTFTNLPAGVTATYSNASGAVTFSGTPATLASGANQNLTVNIGAAPFNLTSITASTTVGTTDYQGADTGANSASSTVTVIPVADVATSITPSPNPAVAGQPLSFAVTYTNAGPSPAPDFTPTLQLTAGLGAGNVTFTNLPAGVSAAYNNATGAVSFTGTPTSLANGANQNLTVNIASVPAALASITASTTVGTTANQGADTGANSATSTVPVATPTDLSTTLSGPTAATSGNEVTLHVTTTNNGPATGYNVVQTVQLVGGLTNVFISNNGTYNSGSGLVTFPALPSLASGQTVTNYISFKAPATALTPTATVTPNTAATGDTNPANNTAGLNGVSGSSLSINAVNGGVANLYTTISPSAQTVNAGASVTLTAVTGNAGPATAYNVVETVQLQPGLSGLLINGGGATGPAVNNEVPYANGNKYNTLTGVVTFAPLATLASGARATNTLTFAAPASMSGQLLATAAVGSTSTTAGQATSDPMPADNVASTKVMVTQPNADLAATITGPTSVVFGQPVTYTATFANNGASAASNAVATVQLPAGLSDVTLSQGDYDPATGLVTFPTVASAARGTALSYTVSYTPTTTGTYVASANYTSSNPDNNAVNNTARISTMVMPSADLSVQLNAPASAAVGGAVTYVAQTTNNGPQTATAVVTTIRLPAGLAAASVTSSGGTYDPATGLVTFNTASLENGVTVTNFATYTNASATTFTGQAVVSSATSDPATANNTANTSTTVSTTAGAVDIATTLTSPTATPVAPGSAVTLNISYNNGASSTSVTGVVEALYLPPGTVVNSGPTGYTYDITTGVLIFPGTSLSRNGAQNTDNYAVTVTAPSAGASFSAVSVVSLNYAETVITNNRALLTIPLVQPAAPTGYDEQTAITGPASALPGTAVTYTVQTLNNGPANSGAVVQSVSFPAGTVVTNNGGGTVTSTATTTTITFPTINNQVPGAGGDVFNTFTVTMPASGNLVVNASLTAAGETAGNTANNTASTTTTRANQVPVAASVVNALMGPRGNTAEQQPISPLAGTDADGNIDSYQLTSLPNAISQGTLYYDNGGTYTAITSPTQALTTTQAQTLRFVPVQTFVGNITFAYTATDNLGSVSTPALYTIQVGQDINSVYSTVVRGGNTNQYQNGDIVAYGIDTNGAVYNAAGAIYDPATNRSGALTGTNPGLLSASISAADATALAAVGIVFSSTTGLFTVSDRTKLPRAGQTIPVNVTTVDLFGGVNTNAFNLVLGQNPLPVELTLFTASAVRNADAALVWRTASEKNNDHFEVERSFSGTDFAPIAQVKGQGSTSAPTDYALTDAGVGAKAVAGVVYYRLKQVDLDGTVSYSPVRPVAFTKVAQPAISLYPNPAASNTALDLRQLPAGSYQVYLLDATGRRVLDTELGAGLVHGLELGGLASGSYLVLVRGNSLNLTKRLMKE